MRSYLGAYGLSPRHDALLDDITRLEVIVTDSVMEALALENNLIKQRMPRYNILLRDDKNYPYLQLTTSEAFPRVLVARSVEKNEDFYAGPFLPAKLARRTMTLSHRLFGIRSCNEVITGNRARPCLEYTSSLHRPVRGRLCSHEVTRRVASTIFCSKGQRRSVETLAVAWGGFERRAFEDAAQLRMRCARCRRSVDSQKVDTPDWATATCLPQAARAASDPSFSSAAGDRRARRAEHDPGPLRGGA